MNRYLICTCDDDLSKVNLIAANIKTLRSKYSFLDDPQELKFKDILESNLLSTIRPDLLILDLYDKESGEWSGKLCLELIKASNLNIPTIIFYGDKEGPESYDNFKEDYSFVLAEINKRKDKTKGLLAVIESELLKRLPLQFELRFENDLILQSQILAIGENNLNQICKSIRDKYGMDKVLILERMVSGYSGAVLFKFNVDNTDYILKASTETLKLLMEFENAKKYYHKFPFFNYIGSDVIKTSDGKAVAIVIKLIENGKPLFDFINEKDNLSDIEKVLYDIFLSDYSLKKHYRDNRSDRISWTAIFEKFGGARFAVISNLIDELDPLIRNANFNAIHLKNFLMHQSFEHLDKTTVFKDSISVLCHGDMHSRNILVQGMRPILIDTGGIKYDYWCMDICRLIVDLFMKGIDHRSIDFYDIHKVKENVDLARSVFLQEKVALSGKNKNFKQAIDWLMANCSEIYGDLYTPLEFHLGLIKEFLQASTRVETLPPNKRAIAILAAYEGMLIANKSLNAS